MANLIRCVGQEESQVSHSLTTSIRSRQDKDHENGPLLVEGDCAPSNRQSKEQQGSDPSPYVGAAVPRTSHLR